MPLSSLAASSGQKEEDELYNLSTELLDLNPQEQGQFLREQEERMRSMKHVDRRIFLLRGDARALMAKAAKIEEVLADVDGTLNGVGDNFLYQQNIDELHELAHTGIHTTAVTGRHPGQINRLYQKHHDHLGIDEFIAEQGALRMKGRNHIEYFLGNETIERDVSSIRDSMSETLHATEREFAVTFIPTSEGGHRSMYSVDAMRYPLTKIDDKHLHRDIAQALAEGWMRISNSMDWNLGTSSTGTFEWAHRLINKDVAVNKYLSEKGAHRHTRAFLGDSSNDLPVFKSNGLFKGVVVNSHTSDELIAHGDIATVGTGNAAPILKMIREARRNGHNI